MSFLTFSFVTTVGSALWCCVLAYLGHKAYRVEPQLLTDPAALVRFVRGESHWLVIVVAVFALLYMLTMRLSQPKKLC
jgi:membrane protein DedA with SNARE-associated domain